MRKMNKKEIQSSIDKINLEPVNKRLDGLIRIMLEIHFDKKNRFNLTTAVKALNSCGLGPTEIANILGKKLTDVAPLLYTKRIKKKGKKSDEAEKTEVIKND